MALKSRNYKSEKFLFPCREGEVVLFSSCSAAASAARCKSQPV